MVSVPTVFILRFCEFGKWIAMRRKREVMVCVNLWHSLPCILNKHWDNYSKFALMRRVIGRGKLGVTRTVFGADQPVEIKSEWHFVGFWWNYDQTPRCLAQAHPLTARLENTCVEIWLTSRFTCFRKCQRTSKFRSDFFRKHMHLCIADFYTCKAYTHVCRCWDKCSWQDG